MKILNYKVSLHKEGKATIGCAIINIEKLRLIAQLLKEVMFCDDSEITGIEIEGGDSIGLDEIDNLIKLHDERFDK